jgi:hypothetical protein
LAGRSNTESRKNKSERTPLELRVNQQNLIGFDIWPCDLIRRLIDLMLLHVREHQTKLVILNESHACMHNFSRSGTPPWTSSFSHGIDTD